MSINVHNLFSAISFIINDSSGTLQIAREYTDICASSVVLWRQKATFYVY